MKILIVSGFLGAGKTTFIKRLARNVDQRFAILENEYGAAGIDGARLGQNRQGTQKNVWEMTEQCICCIGKKDFAASVLTIRQCGRPGIPDRRTDRRRKSRPDYRKSGVRSSTREFSFSRRSLLWMFTVTAAIWRNIPSCIRIRSEARIRSLFPKQKHARRKKNSASRNFCRKLTRRQKSSRIMHPR